MRYTVAIIRDGEVVDSVEVETDPLGGSNDHDYHVDDLPGQLVGSLQEWVHRRIVKDLERKL